ncbi:hypothetical protein BDW75DRAFT_72965 [Aspergillus navahoensis]
MDGTSDAVCRFILALFLLLHCHCAEYVLIAWTNRWRDEGTGCRSATVRLWSCPSKPRACCWVDGTCMGWEMTAGVCRTMARTLGCLGCGDRDTSTVD